MSEEDLAQLMAGKNIAPWRMKLARWVESKLIQRIVIGLIILNAIVLGMETSAAMMESWGPLLVGLDKLCLVVFVIELAVKMLAYRGLFWRNGWNWFDFIVVGIALVPTAGAWSVLRAFRVLRVLRLLTAIPSLKKVVAAFLHSIPGLMGVVAVMIIFFYVGAVLATRLFGEAFPQWFGSIGASLFSLFQIMTLESWSMGIVRPVMEVFPWAWAFFVPFIMIATFTILNLFIGIIVSTMQELSSEPTLQDIVDHDQEMGVVLSRMEQDLADLKRKIQSKAK